MARTIVLPYEINDKVTNLAAKLQEEVCGVLLYTQHQELCPVEYLFITGAGKVNQVSTLPTRLAVLNEFYKLVPAMKYVEFHTHSAGTIRDCGEYYARNFSGQDQQMMLERFSDDPAYLHLLFTPVKKILASCDDSQATVIKAWSNYRKRSREIGTALNLIAQEMEIDISQLPVMQIR